MNWLCKSSNIHNWEKKQARLIREETRAVSGGGGRMLTDYDTYQIEEKCRRCGETRTREETTVFNWQR